MDFIVELDKESWLAPWPGDPGRTLVRSSATRYQSEHAAYCALEREKRKNPFRNFDKARIVEA